MRGRSGLSGERRNKEQRHVRVYKTTMLLSHDAHEAFERPESFLGKVQVLIGSLFPAKPSKIDREGA